MTTLDVYEVTSTRAPDLYLDEQIEQGLNDWCAEDTKGRVAFGHTRDEAIANFSKGR